MSESGPPAWFWKLLDQSRPSLQSLVASLEKLPRTKLIAFARAFDDASMEISEPWDGPEVDGMQFSEDSTEDFTSWVVGQGRELWSQAISAEDLSELVRQYWREEKTSWDTVVKNPRYRGYQSCRGVATAIFKVVHDGDLADELEALDE